MELSRSDAMPSFHDGSFDGLYLPGDKRARLFLTTLNKEQFTIVLDGVEALRLCDVKEGNIVNGVLFIDTNELTEGHISFAHDLSDIARDKEHIAACLASAQKAGLRGLAIKSSYGLEGVVLFKRIEFSKGPHENARGAA